jgi:hypothetical protein
LLNLSRRAKFQGMATSSNKVFIFDTTLRDGEQAPGCSMTTSEKVRMAGKLAELGVDIMEAGFPIASTGDFEAVQAVSRALPVKVAALARCTSLDIERAAQALDKAKSPPRIHTFLATSDIHLKYKLKKTRAQVLDEAAKAVALARKYVDDVEFSAEDGGRTEVGYLIDVSRAVVAAGAGTVNIPDTVGYAIPEEYGVLIGQVAKALGDAARSARVRDRHQDDRAVSGQPAADLDHRRRRPAQQGDRRGQRVRSRGRHPPGRLPQGAHHLRDHRPQDRRCAGQQAGPRQAQRPPRAARAL